MANDDVPGDVLYRIILMYYAGLQLELPLDNFLKFTRPVRYLNVPAVEGDNYLVKITDKDIRQKPRNVIADMLEKYRRGAFLWFDILKTSNRDLIRKGDKVI